MAGPLADVRVVDLSPLLPGPYTTRLLADLGARVTTVVRPGGDPIRELLPGVHEFLARDKAQVVADLRDPHDLAAVHALIAEADVVVEAFRPGVADRLDVGFPRARALQPTVVYCSISGFGQDGPLRDAPGHDIAYEAAGGAFAGPLAAGETPSRPHLPVGDLGAAAFAALDVVATLRDPARTDAVHLDVSMLECVAYLAVTRWGTALLDGRPPDAADLGNLSPGHRVYATGDGHHVALAAVEDRFWHGLAAALDAPELAAPPWDTHVGRMADRLVLEGRVADAVVRWDRDDLLAACASHDVPAVPVLDAVDAATSPALRARGALVDEPDGTTRLRHPVQVRRAGPGPA